MQAIARLAGFTVADRVCEDDVVFRRVERLAHAEELSGEGRREEAGAGAAGAVHDQNGVTGGRADGGVVEPQLGQRLAGGESKILDEVVALDRVGVGGSPDRGGEHERDDESEHSFDFTYPSE